ncbi:serine hydrolase domain-containing protein [Parasphingorhabdus sp.]|uniref:serine hydrolase domain-containing protein n=1 Tax=Parasphingorhabdus sp. TaxID=2709688 RepID=UPI002F91DE8F
MDFIRIMVFGAAALIGSIMLSPVNVDQLGLGQIGLGQATLPPPSPLTPKAAAKAEDQAMPQERGEAEQLTKDDLDAWLDGYMPYALNSGDIPGAVVTVVKDGEILTARGYGYADVEKHTPVIPDQTLFRPGSVSKLVTWTAVMQEVEKGNIDLDADVNTYLDFKIPARGDKPVTMRHLMTHTAGFEEAVKYLIMSDTEKLMSLEDYLKRWVPERIFDAGTTPAYSNWGTALAGYIVQRVSGMPFNDYVDQNIFAPLGMDNSTFRQPLAKKYEDQMATGYSRASEDPIKFELVGAYPAGSLSSTGTDMARFMIAHLQKGELDGKRIMSAETAEMMHNSPLTVIPPLNRMELGFFETNTNGRQVIAHLGDTQGFHSSLHLFMDENVGFYVSFNGGGRMGAAGTLRNAVFEDFADRYFPSELKNGPNDQEPDGKVAPELAKEHAEMMAGNWQVSRRSESSFIGVTGLLGQMEVSIGPDGELVIPSLLGKGGAPRHWVEIAPFVWRDLNSEDRLAAVVEDGKVVRWSVDPFSPFMVFEPIPAHKSPGWILPLLYISLGILALTFLLWPVAAFVRRKYAAPLAVTGKARLAYRLTRIFAVLVLAVLAGWAVAISMMFSDLDTMTEAFDGWLWFLQIAGLIAFVGAVIVTGWNMFLTWREGRHWTAKLWNILLFLAALMIFYCAFVFKLMAMTVNY